ncbi:ABC transporter permease [Halovivax cerinus]|uniref:ABC transporter permease n=1 Tax=Halovivax cerinus TaxID=1487865 RepID=A0ABD5NL15_9EURY
MLKELRHFRRSWGVVLVVVYLAVSVRRIARGVTPPAGTSQGGRYSTYTYLDVPETFDAVYAVYGFTSPSWHVNSLLFLVPLIGLLLGYGTIATERETGQLFTSLSLPSPRSTVLYGTYFGRAIVLACAIGVVLAVGWISITNRFETVSVWRYLVFSLATIGYGLVWLSIGVAISAVFSTARRAAAGVFVAFGYQLLPVHEVVLGLSPLYPYYHVIDPRQAYLVLVAAPYDHLIPKTHVDAVLGSGGFGSYQMSTEFAADAVPWFFSWPIAVAVLALWIAFPLWFACNQLDRLERTSNS